jgi:YfiH family protein
MSAPSSASTLRAARVPELDRVPGLLHGFEQRLGPAGWEEREESRRRVASALEPHGRLLLLRQVHGTALRVAPWEGRPEGDAALAERPGLLLGIETADCLPLLLVDPRRRAVAAAHAGWRGTAAGVATAAVNGLVERGSRAEDLLAALGPANEACCYEVGPELEGAFGAEWEALTRVGPRGKPHLDVRAANVRQLVRAGLRADRIHHLADCTSCRPDLYHSYRREGQGGGRMISFVGFAASSPDR